MTLSRLYGIMKSKVNFVTLYVKKIIAAKGKNNNSKTQNLEVFYVEIGHYVELMGSIDVNFSVFRVKLMSPDFDSSLKKNDRV